MQPVFGILYFAISSAQCNASNKETNNEIHKCIFTFTQYMYFMFVVDVVHKHVFIVPWIRKKRETNTKINRHQNKENHLHKLHVISVVSAKLNQQSV